MSVYTTIEMMGMYKNKDDEQGFLEFCIRLSKDELIELQKFSLLLNEFTTHELERKKKLEELLRIEF